MRLNELVAGWQKYSQADGILLMSPHGLDVAALRIIEELRPIRPFAAIVDEIRVRAGHAEAPLVGAQWFETLEGEYAVIGTLLLPGVQRTLAMVLRDDSFVLIDGGAQPAMADHVAELVRLVARHYFIGLGEIRRRPFLYDPPPGWSALRHRHATRYLHPDQPLVGGIITAHDARPAALNRVEAQDRVLFVDAANQLTERSPPFEPMPIASRHALTGLVHKVHGQSGGRPATHLQATLIDDRFAYIVQMEAPRDDVEDVIRPFLDLVRSIRPVPKSLAVRSAASLIHWAE